MGKNMEKLMGIQFFDEMENLTDRMEMFGVDLMVETREKTQ